MQVLIGLDGCGVVAVFPESTQSAFALIVGLCRATRDQLHMARAMTASPVSFTTR